jgi:hypothetical protein
MNSIAHVDLLLVQAPGGMPRSLRDQAVIVYITAIRCSSLMIFLTIGKARIPIPQDSTSSRDFSRFHRIGSSSYEKKLRNFHMRKAHGRGLTGVVPIDFFLVALN